LLFYLFYSSETFFFSHPGADAERRRRATKKEKKAALALGSAPSAPPPAASAPLKLGSAPPPDYLQRMKEKSTPVAAVRMQQDSAYEASLAHDLAKEEESTLASIIEQTLKEHKEREAAAAAEAERLAAEEKDRARAKREKERSEFKQAQGDIVLRFTLPSGATVQQSFRKTDTVETRVAAFLLAQEELVDVRWRAVVITNA